MRPFLLTLCLFLVSCDYDSFYTTSHFEDADVLPLIKPYRLLTAMHGTNYPWCIESIALARKKTGGIGACVNYINVVDRVIFARGLDGDYVVVNPDTDSVAQFREKDAWHAYLMQMNINSDDIYPVLTLYANFEHNHKSLPWYNQIKSK